jgi:hypothetical protein
MHIKSNHKTRKAIHLQALHEHGLGRLQHEIYGIYKTTTPLQQQQRHNEGQVVHQNQNQNHLPPLPAPSPPPLFPSPLHAASQKHAEIPVPF